MLGSILGALGQIGLSAIPDILGGGANYLMQQNADSKAYKRQVKLLKMQQAYNTQMANTAHQRQVKDLRAAGLNPILSATGGNGAATPVTSAPSVSAGSRQDFFEFDNFLNDLKTGAEIGVAENTGKKLKADSDVAKATVDKINTETEGLRLENKLKKSKVNLLKPLTDFSEDQAKDGYWNDVKRGTKRLIEPYLHSARNVVADVLKPLFVDKPLGGNELHRNSQDALFNEAIKNHPGFEVLKKGELIYSHPKKKIEYNKIRMRSNEELDREFKKLKRGKK